MKIKPQFICCLSGDTRAAEVANLVSDLEVKIFEGWSSLLEFMRGQHRAFEHNASVCVVLFDTSADKAAQFCALEVEFHRERLPGAIVESVVQLGAQYAVGIGPALHGPKGSRAKNIAHMISLAFGKRFEGMVGKQLFPWGEKRKVGRRGSARRHAILGGSDRLLRVSTAS